MNKLILIRGGGDLASGVALRLLHSGFQIVITELPRPLAVRRLVSFSEAVYAGQITVEDMTGRLVTANQVDETLARHEVPVLVDPDADILLRMTFSAVIDARLIKKPPMPLPTPVPLHIGLGPGFHAGSDCHAVIETRRGHTLGRVYWDGETAADSGQPDGDKRRVLRAPCDGTLVTYIQVGEHCEAGVLIAEIVDGETRSQLISPFPGVLRGLLPNGMAVTRGLKLGDIDARDDPALCRLASDKALAIGGAVLEALLGFESKSESNVSRR
jgi:xanthine dehydrogenase accessory factor